MKPTKPAQTKPRRTFLDLLTIEKDRYLRKGLFWQSICLVLGFAQVNFIIWFGHFIWPTVLAFLNEHHIEDWLFSVLFSWIYNACVFAVCNLVFMIIYKLEHPFFEQYKVQKDEKWPWNQDAKAWRELLNKTLQVVLMNNLVIVPCVLYIGVLLSGGQATHSFDIKDLPTAWTLIWQYCFCLIIEDAVFTFTHSMLHRPFLYKRVHKLHHTYTQAIGLSAEYAHPLEFVLGNMLPLGIPCMILGKRMHYYTFMAIGTMRIIGTTLGHSGYDFPFEPSELLPFRATTAYHDYHHQGNINGNMGGGTVLVDFIFGLNEHYYDHLEKLYGPQSKDSKKD